MMHVEILRVALCAHQSLAAAPFEQPMKYARFCSTPVISLDDGFRIDCRQVNGAMTEIDELLGMPLRPRCVRILSNVAGIRGDADITRAVRRSPGVNS